MVLPDIQEAGSLHSHLAVRWYQSRKFYLYIFPNCPMQTLVSGMLMQPARGFSDAERAGKLRVTPPAVYQPVETAFGLLGPQRRVRRRCRWKRRQRWK
jgi:hypothetical protein